MIVCSGRREVAQGQTLTGVAAPPRSTLEQDKALVDCMLRQVAMLEESFDALNEAFGRHASTAKIDSSRDEGPIYEASPDVA
jgi:hypothetical protein